MINRANILYPPGYILPKASLDFNFVAGKYFQIGLPVRNNVNDYITTSRASTGYAIDGGGTYLAFASNVPRITNLGLLVEESRTNLALWCRDLTNAVWVKTTMTTALTATGIDATANSATTITASGALSTILQTIVHASSADTISFFVRRRIGTGVIEITGDGVSYTDITSSLSTSRWYRASVSATLVNPVFGLRITTNGDAVDVDFAHLEVATFVTSPILTTTASVTRSADVITVTAPPTFGSAFSLYESGTPQAPTTYTTNQTTIVASDGTNTNRGFIFRANTTGLATATAAGAVIETNAAFNGSLTPPTVAQNSLFKSAAIYTVAGVNLSRVNLGSRPDSSFFFNGTIARAAVWPTNALPSGALQSITAGS